MTNFWDYSVWGGVLLPAILLIGLLAGHSLKRSIKGLRDSLIPTSVIGGGLLLIFSIIYKLIFGTNFFEEPWFGVDGVASLEVLTYHTLALGFVASALKKNKDKGNKERAKEIFNTGVTTVSTYLLQGIVGLGITILVGFFIKDIFKAAGLLLPFGYGQGTGQALNYGTIYETEHGFFGGKSFGLSIAALGFISAGIGGVVHLILLKKKGNIEAKAKGDSKISYADIQEENEIPMQESLDKITVQVAFTVSAYIIAYMIMGALGRLVPSMKAVIYGFNFLLGVLSGILVKTILNFLRKKKIIHREYLNNFLLTRISNFFFDIMVVAGIAAIRIEVIKRYGWLLLVLGVVGAVITYLYNKLVANKLFKKYADEQFLMMFGMLTGTASTGIILLREIDPEFETPAADNMVYQNFPAIVFGLPMMFLALLAPTKPELTLGILTAFFIVMNVILFRSYIFKKKK